MSASPEPASLTDRFVKLSTEVRDIRGPPEWRLAPSRIYLTACIWADETCEKPFDASE
jgi:hypothetical protein